MKSRNTQVDVDACASAVGGSRFQLILVAAERARMIAEQQKDNLDTNLGNPMITALLEIQNSVET